MHRNDDPQLDPRCPWLISHPSGRGIALNAHRPDGGPARMASVIEPRLKEQ
jgi:hypothetical protein